MKRIIDMKKILILLVCVCSFVTYGRGQNLPVDDMILAGENHESLKVIFINKQVSTHFVMMEDIEYVDISVANIVGNQPNNNTLRVKPVEEGANGVITIVTERHMVQYYLVYTNDLNKVYTRINVPYADLRSYMNPETNLTRSQMYDYAYRMFISRDNFFDVSTKEHGMEIKLNNIYTMDKYFFIDVSLFNKSNIRYDIDLVRFKIEDKKQTKSTNYQEIEIQPILAVENDKVFKKKYRNIFVFEKFTFPDQKVFSIEFSEKQISGRTIKLMVNYEDILNADAFIQ